MAVTTKKTFPATTNSTTDTFGPIGIELNNQDDLDVYITESGGTRVLQYKQTSASTTDSNHPQVNDTTGLYFPPVAAGVALKNYTISADNNNVIFNSDLPSGAVVSVERRTRDSSSSYTSFSGGSTIRSTDLNTAFDETRFTAQEGRNKAFDLERQTFSEDGNIRLLEDQSLVYEGATDDAYETTLAITDPTADRTITFPNVSGNVVTTGDTGTVNATMLATDSVDSDELVNGSIDTDHIANDQVTYAKIQDVTASGVVLGRNSSGAGIVEEVTAAELRTILNVESGSTGDQSNTEIRAAVEAASDSNVFTDADHTKLNGIEASATADQTGAEIKSAYEGESNTNAYTDAEKTKLAGVETSADVTDATNVNAAGAVMNSDLDGKGELLVGDGSGDPSALGVGTNGYILTADSSEATGIKWAANAGGGGGSGASEAFKTIAVSGQNNVVADSATDTLTLAAGSNVTITTNDSTDTVTIAASGGGGGISDVVSDTSPQLGGDLDVNGNDIVSTSNANINIIPNGTGDVNLDADTIRVGDNNTDTTITTQGTGDLTLSTNSGTNSGTIEIEDGADNDIVITPNGTGDVIIDGLKYPQSDGTNGQVLKTNGSAQLSWGYDVIVWTLGINGGANAYTFTGDGFASATDNPKLYLSRGQTYKFVNGNSSGTHAFNIEKSDHDATWSAYTTGMTGAGATGGNTMTWTVPMDAPSLLKYVSGTTSGMTGFIYIADGNNSDEGFECWTGSRVSGLQIDNGPNGSHMAFFGTHPTGYQPTIIGSSGTTTTFQQSAGYDFDSGNINLQSYGTNTTTPATIKFEGGGSNNTYGPTISGPATAQATSNYTITLPGVVPTSNGQVLSATTAGVCSWADQSSGTITALNNQTADRLTTIGATTTELDGEASLTFNDAATTGLISGRQITGRGFECPAEVSDDWTIAAGNNAFFPGPMTVAANKTVTVPANRTLTIV